MGYSRSYAWVGVFAKLGVVTLFLALSVPPGSRAVAQQPAPAKPAAPAATAADPAAALNARIARLEEQLVDMQVMIATLETLVKTGAGNQAPAAPAAPAAAGGDPGNLPWRSDTTSAPPEPESGGDIRLRALETQIQALTNQLSVVTSRLDKLQGAPAAAVQPTPPAPVAPPAPVMPPAPVVPPVAVSPPGTGVPPPPGASVRPGQPTPSLAPPTPASTEYQQAYGHLLGQDFDAAEAAFSDFLKRHPKDKLAGNAKYWLGEAHYARRKYRKAADAFLRSYTDHPGSEKASESLLKLGMSLHQIGQKQAACATFAELKKRFPNAPAALQQRASREAQQSGCR